jgi:iron(III) transport system substrate-binding protein
MRLIATILCALVSIGCSGGNGAGSVTVYVATDRQIAEPILAAFEQETGIAVDALFDTEANKTSGLVNRLIAEASRPRADVFWNNEVAQMARLDSAGVLATWSRSTTPAPHIRISDAPAWAAFAARIRVLIVHQRAAAAQHPPASLSAFTDPRWKGQAALANPHFGSTGAHFAALLTQWGENGFREWLRALRANDVAVLAGNAQVKDAVVAGRYSFGLTDTDDVNEAVSAGKSVKLVVPDQGPGESGALLIPNTVALIRGARNEDNARRLADYLLSARVEGALAQGRGVQIPIRSNVPGPALLPPLAQIKALAVDYSEVARAYERMLQIVDEEWPS